MSAQMTVEDMKRLNSSPEDLLQKCPPEIDLELVRIAVQGRVFPRRLAEDASRARTVEELIKFLDPFGKKRFLYFYLKAYAAKYNVCLN